MSKTPDTQAHTLSGPGRSSYCPAVVQDREGKVATPKPEMYGMKKSDVGIVATNAANKGEVRQANWQGIAGASPVL